MELNKLCKIKGGKRIPKGSTLTSISTDHPYIKVKDMSFSTIQLTKNFEYVENDAFEKIKRYTVNKGDVILSIVGTIGNVSLIGETLDGASLTENCVKFICNNSILSKYLFYFLSSPNGQKEIRKGIVGSTQPKLPIYNIETINVPNISIEEQQHIVDTRRCCLCW